MRSRVRRTVRGGVVAYARLVVVACATLVVVACATLVALPALAQLVAPKLHPPPPVEFPADAPQTPVRIKLLLRVAADGSVIDAKEMERDPVDALDVFVDRAIAHAKTLRFDPATKDGAPIEAKIPYTVRFDPPAAAAASTSAAAIASTSASAVTSATSPPPAPPPPPGSNNDKGAPLGDEPESGHHEATEGDINIAGRTEPRSHGPSDFHIHIGSLAIIPRHDATDLLKLAPGILLTNEGGEGHAEQVFMRGFDAREGQDVEFSVGGVPINDSGNLHGNGYADTHFIIPELVTALRVLEGPFAPQQGNYAVAGSADYELGLEQRGLTTKYTVGSFGTQRLLLLWGPGRDQHTFGGAEVYKTDGWGMNRDAKRGSAIGQYEGSIGEKGTYRIIGTAYSTSFHTAGVIREDDYDHGKIGFLDTYDPLQGGDASRFSIAADIEGSTGDIAYRQLVFFVDRGMRLRENFTGFLLDVQEPLQNPHGQRGDLIDLDWAGLTLGARGSARFRGKAFDLPQELELGYFARGDRSTSTQYRIEAATGHPYHLDHDLDSKLADIGLWVDGNVKFLKWLTLRGGLRADVFTYDVLNKCAVQSVAKPSPANPPGDASCLSQQGFAQYREPVQRSSTSALALMPRASIILGAIHGFTFSASYGTGIRSIDPVYIAQDYDTPFAKVKAYEGGVGYVHSTDDWIFTARSIFFQTKVDRDLIFSETEGRATLANGTTRTGWVGAVRATGDFFDEAANITLVKSTFDDTKLLIPYVPDLVLRSDTAVFHALPFTIDGAPTRGAIGVGLSYVGHRALPYGQRSDVLFTVDTTATLGWRGFEVGLSVTNLFDRRYRLGELNYASDFRSEPQPTLVPMRHFTAGMPRAIFLSLSATVGGS